MTYREPSKLGFAMVILTKSIAESFRTIALLLRHPYVSARKRRKAEDIVEAWAVKMHPFAQAVRANNSDSLDMNLHMMLVHNNAPGYDRDVFEECDDAADVAKSMRELRSDMLSERRYVAALTVIPLSWIANLQSYAMSNRLISMYAHTQLPQGN